MSEEIDLNNRIKESLVNRERTYKKRENRVKTIFSYKRKVFAKVSRIKFVRQYAIQLCKKNINIKQSWKWFTMVVVYSRLVNFIDFVVDTRNTNSQVINWNSSCIFRPEMFYWCLTKSKRFNDPQEIFCNSAALSIFYSGDFINHIWMDQLIIHMAKS